MLPSFERKSVKVERGGWLTAGKKQRTGVLCPYHKELTPSCSLEQDDEDWGTGIWHCFGCGREGFWHRTGSDDCSDAREHNGGVRYEYYDLVCDNSYRIAVDGKCQK